MTGAQALALLEETKVPSSTSHGRIRSLIADKSHHLALPGCGQLARSTERCQLVHTADQGGQTAAG